MPDREKLIKALECCLKPDASCVECPYYEETLHTGEMCGYRRKRDALALLKEQELAMPRWIPVTERLPEVGTEVLVYAVGKIDGFIGQSVIEITDRFIFRLFPSSEGTEMWSAPCQYFLTDYEITHWMPLPEPPKEEDDAE